MPTEIDPRAFDPFGIIEPKKEGAKFGWWDAICAECKRPLLKDIVDTNVFWSFQCGCPKIYRDGKK